MPLVGLVSCCGFGRTENQEAECPILDDKQSSSSRGQCRCLAHRHVGEDGVPLPQGAAKIIQQGDIPLSDDDSEQPQQQQAPSPQQQQQQELRKQLHPDEQMEAELAAADQQQPSEEEEESEVEEQADQGIFGF